MKLSNIERISNHLTFCSTHVLQYLLGFELCVNIIIYNEIFKSRAREAKDNLRATMYQAKTPEKIVTMTNDEPDCPDVDGDDVVYKGDTVKCVIGVLTQDNCCMNSKQYEMLKQY